jgi:hypothetical protein
VWAVGGAGNCTSGVSDVLTGVRHVAGLALDTANDVLSWGLELANLPTCQLSNMRTCEHANHCWAAVLLGRWWWWLLLGCCGVVRLC